MADILKVATPVVPGEQANRLLPQNARQANVMNIPDPTRVTQVHSQNVGNDKQAEKFSPNFESNFEKFAQILRALPNMTQLYGELFFTKTGFVAEAGIDSGFTEEISEYLDLIKMSDAELLEYIKSQSDNSVKFTGPFFDIMRSIVSNSNSPDMVYDILDMLRKFDSMQASPHIINEILTNLANISKNMFSSSRQEFGNMINNLVQAFSAGDSQATLSVLKNEILPFLSAYVNQTRDYGALRDHITMYTLNLARYEIGTAESFIQSFRTVMSYQPVLQRFPGIDVSKLENFFIKNSPMGNSSLENNPINNNISHNQQISNSLPINNFSSIQPAVTLPDGSVLANGQPAAVMPDGSVRIIAHPGLPLPQGAIPDQVLTVTAEGTVFVGNQPVVFLADGSMYIAEQSAFAANQPPQNPLPLLDHQPAVFGQETAPLTNQEIQLPTSQQPTIPLPNGILLVNNQLVTVMPDGGVYSPEQPLPPFTASNPPIYNQTVIISPDGEIFVNNQPVTVMPDGSMYIIGQSAGPPESNPPMVLQPAVTLPDGNILVNNQPVIVMTDGTVQLTDITVPNGEASSGGQPVTVTPEGNIFVGNQPVTVMPDGSMQISGQQPQQPAVDPQPQQPVTDQQPTAGQQPPSDTGASTPNSGTAPNSGLPNTMQGRPGFVTPPNQNQTPINPIADKFTEIISKGVSGEAGAKNQPVFTNIMQSMLINESVYMPLIHITVPADIDGKLFFSEIWVDPFFEEEEEGSNNSGSSSKAIKILVKFDIKDVGYFEVIILSRERSLDLHLYYPESFSQLESQMRNGIREIASRNSLNISSLIAEKMQAPKYISDVFPKIYERKNAVNVVI
ncbi:MAG: hypothetical protein FWH14_03780 [Oscillospiraceae bacterium]|nr:hypothetical protein [Oscillospiraceae bacterium]